MRVILLGPPGAGKGTQAGLITKETGIPVLVMGDMLREAVSRGDEVGKQAESYMKNGQLVPDDVVIKIILGRMSQDDCRQKGFILDGFPRTTAQAEALDKHLSATNQPLDVVLYFSVPKEVIVKRIEDRLTCRNCKHSFPGKGVTSCPNCGSEDLYRRPDDDPKVLESRLDEYLKKTAPLLDYYRAKNKLIEINANRTIEEVLKDSLSQLRKFVR